MTSNTNNSKTNSLEEKILWSSISRNDTILVEAGDDPFQGAVSETAKGILSKKHTSGWEYFSLARGGSASVRASMKKSGNRAAVPKLKAVKFHVHERSFDSDDSDSGNSWDFSEADNNNDDQPQQGPVVWVFAAVYNPEALSWDNQKEVLPDVQAFIQKLVGLTEMDRLTDPKWRQGGQLACQRAFASCLLQRMREVSYLGKMARLNQSVQDTTNMMNENIENILLREEKLQAMNEQSTQLQDMAAAFKKNTKGVRRRMMLNNAKHGIVLGSAITAGVAVVTVPPTLAVL